MLSPLSNVSINLFYLACFFITGIGLASVWLISWSVIFILVYLALVLWLLDRRSKGAIFLIGLSLGAAYLNYQIERRQLIEEAWQQEDRVVLIGTVITSPEIRPTGSYLKLKVDWAVQAQSELRGHVAVLGDYSWSEFLPGQKLMIMGQPSLSDDFQEYRLKSGLYATFFHPRLKPVGHPSIYQVTTLMARLQKRASAIIKSRLVEPASSLLEAMLLGREISKSSLAEDLSRTGLNHIAVVSGMHLVVLTGLLRGILNGIGLNYRRSAIVILIIILFFILLTGGRPAIWRAGLMVGFGLLGSLLGRIYQPERAIIWAAVILLLINPMFLRWDIGFQLSFLAAAGLIGWTDRIKRWLEWIPGVFLQEALAVTLAAQLATVPLVAYYFQQISLVGPLANVLIVAFLPLVFGLGLIFVCLVGCSPISWLMGLTLTLLTEMIFFFSSLKWATITVVVPVWLVVTYYLAWALLTWSKAKKASTFHVERLC